jgi:hypothetical protein
LRVLSLFKDSGNKEGLLAVYDASTLKLLETYPSHGIEAHDMAVTRDKRFLAIGHYGIAESNAKDPDAFVAHKPSLSIIDMDSFGLVKHMPFDKPVNLGHLVTGKGSTVYGVLEQYIRTKVSPNNPPVKIDEKRNALMKDGGWPLIDLELDDGNGIAIPTPLLEFDFEQETIKEHFTSNLTQRRPQSVIYNESADKVVAAYIYSGHLVVVHADGTSEAITAEDIGVPMPVGLSEIEGTPYISVVGLFYNIAILDVRDMSVVKHISTPVYRSSHTTPYIA